MLGLGLGITNRRGRAGSSLPLYYQVGASYWDAYKTNYLDGLLSEPDLSSATRSAMGASLSGALKWIGGVLGPDGKIYGIPFDATDILQIGTGTPGDLQALMSGWVNKF